MERLSSDGILRDTRVGRGEFLAHHKRSVHGSVLFLFLYPQVRVRMQLCCCSFSHHMEALERRGTSFAEKSRRDLPAPSVQSASEESAGTRPTPPTHD